MLFARSYESKYVIVLCFSGTKVVFFSKYLSYSSVLLPVYAYSKFAKAVKELNDRCLFALCI
jgi:hypothetical protein